MGRPLMCPTCGEVAGASSCASCGAELTSPRVDHVRSNLDRDQSTSDHDQTASDQDQTWSDHDQSASDSDQRSADEDQHAADDDLSAGGDPISHERGALARERSSQDRAAVSALRDESATARARTASARDATASLRDQLSDRDELVRLHELDNHSGDIREDILVRARQDRARAAADRATAAEDRARASMDREMASLERAQAHEERAESALNLRLSTRDDLTGAWTRKFGLEAISRELERTHRTESKLVVAFVDVDGLKEVNDGEGHLAGDALLELVGETLLTSVRPYDIVVRYGGDEFVCGMPGLGAKQARGRFERIAAALTEANAEHSISFGLAEAEPGDTLEDLIARADAALLEERR